MHYVHLKIPVMADNIKVPMIQSAFLFNFMIIPLVCVFHVKLPIFYYKEKTHS